MSSTLTEHVSESSPRLSSQQRQAARTLAGGRSGPLTLALTITGPLDVDRLRAACQTVAARHEILRPARDVSSVFSIGNIADAPASAQDGVSEPLHVHVVRESANEHALVLHLSPLAGDVGTLRLVAGELLAEYGGRAASRDQEQDAAGLSYADVCAWQQELLDDEAESEAGRRYWRRLRASLREPEALPFERDAATVPDVVSVTPMPRRGRVVVSADGASDVAREIVAANRALPAFWLVCWQALFQRLSGGTPFIVDVTVEGRKYDELREVIGPLDRTLLVPTTLRARESVADACAALEEVLQAHVDWQEYVDADLPEDAPAARLGFAYARWSDVLTGNAPLVCRAEASVDTTGAALALVVHEHADRWDIAVHYDGAAFELESVRRIGGWIATFARDAATRLRRPLDACSPLTSAERAEIATSAGVRSTDPWSVAERASLGAAFEAQAARTPEAPALTVGQTSLDYATLNARVNQLARHLRQLGVGPDVLVAVCVERTADLVLGLLATLKAGGAYVPLDPTYPADRLALVLEDARPRVLLTQQPLMAALPAHQAATLCLDTEWDVVARQDASNPSSATVAGSLAYVMYTSGSTGRPKGVMLPHGTVINFFAGMDRLLDDRERGVWFAVTSAAFDISVLELIWTLTRGLHVVLVSPDVDTPAAIMRAHGATHLQCTPSWARLLLSDPGAPAALAGLRTMLVGGEALPSPLAADLGAHLRGDLLNMYGPTETTIWSSSDRVTDADRITLGFPILNTHLHIVDRDGHAAPVAAAGEVWIGGDGVARGYLNRPDLTAERFVPDPFGPLDGARVYRTGDRGRRSSDGRIEFLGRLDQQIKLRGHRIELGEVEAALRQRPSVRDAAVVLREDTPGERRLVAYVVFRPTAPADARTSDALQQSLAKTLPEYMVPAVIVILDALPLTPNGKIDRRRLPAPSGDRPTLTQAYVAPRSEVETTLARIWGEVLRVGQVGIHDNFFALGGDSILSLQIVARAMQAGFRLAPRQVFENQTVAALALVTAPATAVSQAEQGAVVGPVPLLPIQHWFFSHPHPAPHYDNQSVRLEIAEEALPVLERAWNAMLRHHDALRFRYERTADGWTQQAAPVGDDVIVPTIDLRSVKASHQARLQERVATRVQAGLDLTRGPVARVVVLRTDAPAPHALFAIHHLVIDGVSWRILLSDLEAACRTLRSGRPLALPPKTGSVRQWAEVLRTHAVSETLAAERPVWTAMSEPVAALPRDNGPDALNVGRSARVLQIAMNADETQALLQDLPARGAGQMQDFLLTALVQALAAWSGEAHWRIDLESHGREELPGDVDLSRTVGWFTTLYPVRFTAEADPLATLRSVKTALRQVPGYGLGYGVLRYLDAPGADAVRAAAPSEVMLNYLGQFDRALPPEGWLRPAQGTTGRTRHRDAPREHALEIVANVSGGQLRLAWTYSANLHTADHITRLTDRFQEALRALIAQGRTASEADVIVASDFRNVDLDASELDRIAQLLDAGLPDE